MPEFLGSSVLTSEYVHVSVASESSSVVGTQVAVIASASGTIDGTTPLSVTLLCSDFCTATTCTGVLLCSASSASADTSNWSTTLSSTSTSLQSTYGCLLAAGVYTEIDTCAYSATLATKTTRLLADYSVVLSGSTRTRSNLRGVYIGGHADTRVTDYAHIAMHTRLECRTTDATLTYMNVGPVSETILNMSDDDSVVLEAHITAYHKEDTQSAAWHIRAAYHKTGGTLTEKYRNVTCLYKDNTNWDCDMNTGSSLGPRFAVTGSASDVVVWTGVLNFALSNNTNTT